MEEFLNKRIAIWGYGVEGQSAAEYLSRKGCDVVVYDTKSESSDVHIPGIRIIFGEPPDLDKTDIIIRSPGISPLTPHLLEAKQKGILVTSVTNVFLSRVPCPVVGVTGTKGKGTTSTLITEMLKAAGRDAYLGGNIGVPPLSFLDKLTPESWVVLELSSFQLMDVHKSPNIAVVLMVTSEHLDYHHDTEEYVEAKAGIVRFQQASDTMIINQDYPNSRRIAAFGNGRLIGVSTKKTFPHGCIVQDGKIRWIAQEEKRDILSVADIFIPGKHNWENVCAAVGAAISAGVPDTAIQHVLRTFQGLVHRIQFVKEVDGVRYFDDSFSTTPETAMAAIAAFEEPKVLILGGSSKQSDFSALGDVIRSSPSIRGIIGIGEEWKRIRDAIGTHAIPTVEGCTTMSEMVQAAKRLAQSGDVVVLSPACASFGLFKNYKDRGEQFSAEVRKLEE